MSLIDGPFQIYNKNWIACEDLQQPGGAIALVPDYGAIEWFEKGFEPYGTVGQDDG